MVYAQLLISQTICVLRFLILTIGNHFLPIHSLFHNHFEEQKKNIRSDWVKENLTELVTLTFCWPFKHQPHKMVKHTQTMLQGIYRGLFREF